MILKITALTQLFENWEVAKPARHLAEPAAAASVAVSKLILRKAPARVWRQSKFPDRPAVLLKAAELDTLHAGAYFNLGFAYARLGETEKAKEAFRRCEALQEAKNDKSTK
jgi:tetratricopeptide (TPR) repeat protein